ncbi:hypothetical protein Ga0466249_005268 [Sporomusaceae bacterium BoRhaA]|uniref:YjcQ family protein n=1 Tax=Pelorhabdus rhamnosifermentans TaxID=2772457 RepID=UPI001C063114|nr:YjcQ family protein [Pelorhabdus rhamnosifermentans]MBU2704115.1 hypothetical protein [Pelorhabdus rhamnosifermentans]
MILSDLGFNILVAMYEGQQKKNPDMSNIHPGKFLMPMKTFAVAIQELQESGLIKGAVIVDGGAKSGPFFALVNSATITLLGENVICEKSKI